MIDYTMKGRTYRYYEGTPLYPFGYGLSYTSFKYSNLSIRPQRVQAGENVTVSVTLTNTGSFDADEVIVYLSNMFKSSWRLSFFFFLKQRSLQQNLESPESFLLLSLSEIMNELFPNSNNKRNIVSQANMDKR